MTRRLRCRRWLPADVDSIYEIYSDEMGSRWVDDGQPITREDAQRWLQVTANNYLRYEYGMFALEELDSSCVIGFCGLVHPNGQVDAEVKYAIRRSHWGHGFASEAVLGLLEYAASVCRLGRVIATVAAENMASKRVLEKSGFRRTSSFRLSDGVTEAYELELFHE